MDLGLDGKVAMVAGASRGLGFAIARKLVEEGASVSLISRDDAAVRQAVSKLENVHRDKTLGLAADVRRAEDIKRWYRKTVERFGAVDHLVTNSGGPPPGSFLDLDDAQWQSAFELLLLSVVRMVRAALPGMKGRKDASILLLTSSTVKEPIGNLALSNVVRAGVTALAKTLANELAGQGIRVNHLVPGRISTDRLRELDEANSERLEIPLEDYRKRAVSAIPLGRYGDPEEFARAAVFLLSPAASYITGATLQVDGGLIRAVL
jgi:3-oxoacyl-[acyl-carrier protein] reductase